MSGRRDAEPSVNRTQVKKGVVGSIANGMLLSFFLSILMTLIAWEYKGYAYVAQQLSSQRVSIMGYLSESNPALLRYNLHVIEKINQSISNGFSQALPSTPDFKKIVESAFFVDLLSKLNAPWHAFQTLMCLTALVFFWKTVGILCSALLFVFASSIGFLDGLVKRYVRTAEAGRESTFVFHRVSQWTLKTAAGLVFIDWVLPVKIHPLFIVIALSMLLYLFFYISSSTLKKYL